MRFSRQEKPLLDEREMQEMYRIEHRGLWAMYTLLCAAVVIQLLLGAQLLQMAGELVVIALVSVGMIAAYAWRGIWDGRPSVRDNALYALASASGVTLLVLACGKTLVMAAVTGAVMFALCFSLLTLLMRYVQRRQEAQSRALEEDNE